MSSIEEILAEFAESSEKEETVEAANPTPHKGKTEHEASNEVEEGREPFLPIGFWQTIKWAALFGSLFALVTYWLFTGQMAASAAVPCLCATAALFGYGIGKHGGR